MLYGHHERGLVQVRTPTISGALIRPASRTEAYTTGGRVLTERTEPFTAVALNDDGTERFDGSGRVYFPGPKRARFFEFLSRDECSRGFLFALSNFRDFIVERTRARNITRLDGPIRRRTPYATLRNTSMKSACPIPSPYHYDTRFFFFKVKSYAKKTTFF